VLASYEQLALGYLAACADDGALIGVRHHGLVSIANPSTGFEGWFAAHRAAVG